MAEPKARFADPMAVTWMEKYSKTLDRLWARLPNFLGSFIATVAVFLLGSSIRAEWLLILVHFIKYLRHGKEEDFDAATNFTKEFDGFSLERYYLKDVHTYIIPATVISYVTYLGVGGFLHWFYYVHQRENAKEWKCQPDKWLTPELERHEIMLGSVSLMIGSIISGIVSCYLMNGGWSTVYYDFNEYGWVWSILQWPVVFIWQDYLTYWHHRWYHTPFLYKNFHKLHHKYKQPTAFSVTAIHPVEFVHMQLVLISPIFLFPVHWLTFCVILAYIYYHGIIDHSGITFKAFWWQPWQPDCIFHDNHHQYFHVNFAFNIEYWDKLHGTYRQKDRIYREDIFYGKGKDIAEASENELAEEMQERQSENPLAFRNNTHGFELDQAKIKKKK